MKQSNALWFLRSPQDERENALYQKAYHNAFFTLGAIASAAIVGISLFGTDTRVDLVHVRAIILLAFAIAYLVGWLALKNEELIEIQSNQSKRSVSPIWIIAIMLTIFIAGVALLAKIFLSAALPFAIIAGVSTISYVYLTAKDLTAGVPLFIRIPICLLFPIQTIGFFLEPTAPVGKRIINAIFTTIIIGALMLGAYVLIFGATSSTTTTTIY